MPVKRTKSQRRSTPAAAKKKAAKRPAAKKTTRKPAPLAVAAPRKQAAPPARQVAAPPEAGIVSTVEAALDEMKALNVKVLDVRKLTDVADIMIIASGSSDRHVRSIADRVVQFAKKQGYRPTGVEGERDGEWVLVDLRDVVVHIMLPRIREFYRLENLWDISAARREAAGEN